MNKRELSSIIAKDIADFLKKGGKIKQIPRGITTEAVVLSPNKKESLTLQKRINDILFTDNNSNDTDNT